MAALFRDEVLHQILKLYAAAVGLSFVFTHDNARPRKAAIVGDYLESKGISRMEWPAFLPI